MARVHRLQQNSPEDPNFAFHCPGCKYGHGFKTTGGSPRWTFNGNMDAPTLSPSYVAMPDGPKRCHSWVKNGTIEFLNDCWHELRGQTVPLPDMDSD